jgi:hypothetical protein
MYRTERVDKLSAGLSPSPEPAAGGGSGNAPYDLSTCQMRFGSLSDVKELKEGELPSSGPAFRGISITVYRYNARENQTADQRAKILLSSLAPTLDPSKNAAPGHLNLNEVFVVSGNDGPGVNATAWGRANNVLIEITYTQANVDGGIPTGWDEPRAGVLALARDAAELLPCVTPNIDEWNPRTVRGRPPGR